MTRTEEKRKKSYFFPRIAIYLQEEGFFGFLKCFIQHWFICRPLDSTVSEGAGLNTGCCDLSIFLLIRLKVSDPIGSGFWSTKLSSSLPSPSERAILFFASVGVEKTNE
jgi:hypothetical protein